MTIRTLMGQHPTGPYGLFVSRPGFDAYGTDPNYRKGWKFSSQWQYVANIVAGGTANTGDTVWFPECGYIPMIFWEVVTALNGDTSLTSNGQPTAAGAKFSNNTTYNFAWSRFRIFNSRNQPNFNIGRNNTSEASANTPYDGNINYLMRYVVFGLKARDYY